MVIRTLRVTCIFPFDLDPEMSTKEENKPSTYEFAGGEICVWLDNSGVICLKSRNKFNDPVELAEHEALDLAQLLNRLVDEQRS